MPGAGIKAINKRIRSVRSTQQITKAMKMVAAAKLRRAQDRLLAGRPYAGKLATLLEHLAAAGGGSHPFLVARPVRKRLFVVVTSDKGLCGAYNLNVIKLAQAGLEKSRDEGIETAGHLRHAIEEFKAARQAKAAPRAEPATEPARG